MSSYLEAFTIRVRRRRTKTANPIGNFDGSHSDLLAFLEAFLSGLNITTSHDQRFKGVLSVEQRSTEAEKRTITGIILAGHYGKTSDFLDINTSTNVFSRRPHHVEAAPFYFKVFLPAAQDEGIILIQRVGISSPLRVLQDFIIRSFRANYREFVLEINPLVDKMALDALLKIGVIDHIKIFTFHLRPRVEDIQDHGLHEEVSASLTIKQNVNEDRGKLSFMAKKLSIERSTGIAELDEHIDFDSQIKLSIDEDGQKHTIDLSNPKLRFRTEVDEPTGTKSKEYRSYLDSEADNFMKRVADKIWGENSNVWKH